MFVTKKGMVGKKKKWVPTIATDDSDYEGRELEPENNHEGKENEKVGWWKKRKREKDASYRLQSKNDC